MIGDHSWGQNKVTSYKESLWDPHQINSLITHRIWWNMHVFETRRLFPSVGWLWQPSSHDSRWVHSKSESPVGSVAFARQWHRVQLGPCWVWGSQRCPTSARSQCAGSRLWPLWTQEDQGGMHMGSGPGHNEFRPWMRSKLELHPGRKDIHFQTSTDCVFSLIRELWSPEK